MKSYALFQQYMWLVDTIYRADKISLGELNQKWVNTYMSDGIPMSRSSFCRHKEEIMNIFGVEILCDRRDGFKYYIDNKEVLKDDSIQNWMLSTLSVNYFLSESKSVSDRILLEHIPSGGEYLRIFIEAMKIGVKVLVKYRRYDADLDKERLVSPYCIKLFNRRWYALVKSSSHESPYILAFDRIRKLSLTEEKFSIDKNFNANSWFRECYGVFRSTDIDLQTIRFRAYGSEANYVRDLPLHFSQREVETNKDWSDFELDIRPSKDFISPLLSRGALIKVLEPKWLAEEVKIQHETAANLYK